MLQTVSLVFAQNYNLNSIIYFHFSQLYMALALSSTDQAFLQTMMAMKAMSANEALKHYNRCDAAAAAHGSRGRAKPLRDTLSLTEKIDNING